MKSLRRSVSQTARHAAIAAVALLLGIVACAPRQTARGGVSVKPEESRKKAPEFTLKDVHGNAVHLSDFKGKVVLLDFWATWCGPCVIEIPWFMEFQRKYKDRGFEVLGVAMDDDGWKSVTPYVEKRKFNYRVVLGDDLTGDQYGGIEALPSTYVIDRNGKIAAVHIGLSKKEEFEDAIQILLDSPVHAAAQSAPGDSAAGHGAVRAGAHADRRPGSHS